MIVLGAGGLHQAISRPAFKLVSDNVIFDWKSIIKTSKNYIKEVCNRDVELIQKKTRRKIAERGTEMKQYVYMG